MDVIVLLIFSGWLAITIIGQSHDKRVNRLRRYDLFNLVPMWTFFAPNPGQNDYHLIYRDQLDDRTVTDWTEIPLTHRRTAYSSLWNAAKRDTKVLADIVSAVASQVQYHQERETPIDVIGDAVMLSTPYLLLLNIVLSRGETSERITHRQFLLAQSHGFNTDRMPEIILCSPFHPVRVAQPTEVLKHAA